MDRGKPENFSERQARAIRDAVAKLRESRGWSQTQLGEALDVGQQAAGRIERMGGATYTVASRIAQLAGFPGLDAMFEAYGVLRDEAPAEDDPWPNRRDAARFARARGIPQHVIDAVRGRYTDTLFRDRAVSWWGLQFHKAYVQELELQEEHRALTATKAEEAHPPKKRPRKAG